MKKMRSLIAPVCLLLPAFMNAQQLPHYTQYILNPYIVNPALAGAENYTDIKISHRRQWTGLTNAPVTSYFTIHGAIGKEDYETTPTSFSVPGKNPRGERLWERYTPPANHHGIGLQIVNDHAGVLNTFSALATYAYHIGLSSYTSLSAGIGIGLRKNSIDMANLQFGDTQPDMVVSGSKDLKSTRLDAVAGLYLHSQDYFAGISALNIIPDKTADNLHAQQNNVKRIPHLFGTAGYKFFVDNDFSLTPSLMLIYVQSAPVQVEFNTKLQYQDLAWIGATYRHHDGIAAMIGLTMRKVFHIGYSYDYTTSMLRQVSGGTHELMIGFIIGNRYADL